MLLLKVVRLACTEPLPVGFPVQPQASQAEWLSLEWKELCYQLHRRQVVIESLIFSWVAAQKKKMLSLIFSHIYPVAIYHRSQESFLKAMWKINPLKLSYGQQSTRCSYCAAMHRLASWPGYRTCCILPVFSWRSLNWGIYPPCSCQISSKKPS